MRLFSDIARSVAWAALTLVLFFGLEPASSAIAFVQVSATAGDPLGSTVTINYPSAQNAGDLNVVIVGWELETSDVASITDTEGNTYALASAPTRGEGYSIAIYYAKNIAAAAAGANTVTVTFTGSVPYPDVRIAEYSGIDTVAPFDVGHGGSGRASVSDSGFATTTSANELIVAGNVLDAGTLSAGTGFTSRIITNNLHILEDRIVTTAGSYNATANTDPGGYVMQMATFKAASGSGDTQAPTAPSGLSATAASSTQINLSWTASTDNVAVTGYEVQRCQGAGCSSFAAVGTPSGTTFSDTGLAPGITYRYQVRARDAVPNWSATSSIVMAATSTSTAGSVTYQYDSFGRLKQVTVVAQ